MSIPNKQIGWSQEENLLWQISKELDMMISAMCTGPCPTSTTSTTTTSAPLVKTKNTFVECFLVDECTKVCSEPFNYYTVWMTQDCIDNWPSIGCEVWLDEFKTTPFPDGGYSNGTGIGCIVITGGIVTSIS